ncbi:hypothetical protein COV81_04830 [Candidatus Peregrinibacteria bacterium CG11_big_fil_rev_8_21_14_0_20_41_10]|nr:MAG: hypothetical protein COV81_04830 [Candidatus Peregrinibacteria bacterium CG11_big_fil_rev_8_21_14_0_20_41_10]PJC37886.1 MAG: hypothetical protein CO045_03000 [Candidatus Peregrinibacteria bacterium CG_4_9_14_0_2_um_filter_41_14]
MLPEIVPESYDNNESYKQRFETLTQQEFTPNRFKQFIRKIDGKSNLPPAYKWLDYLTQAPKYGLSSDAYKSLANQWFGLDLARSYNINETLKRITPDRNAYEECLLNGDFDRFDQTTQRFLSKLYPNLTPASHVRRITRANVNRTLGRS